MQLLSTLNPRKVALVLSVLALYFAAQSLIVEHLIENFLNDDTHRDIIHVVDLFSVNVEESIPTWYAAMLLFGAAALLALIAAAKAGAKDRFAAQWAGLAVIFIYLSIDEGAAVHEVAADVVQTQLSLTGFLYFGWQIVAVPLLILFALFYWRFVFHLPTQTRNLFILAAVIYVGGALVVEGISANQWYIDGGPTFEYLAIATVEEFCEMLGAIILIYTLLSYMVAQRYTLVFQASAATPEPDKSVAEHTHIQIIEAVPFRWSWRSVIVTALVILAGNIALISWINLRLSQDSAFTNQAIIDQLAEYDVQVIPIEGRFGIDNLASRQATAALLAEFDEVIVVTWASAESSLALAADDLPFDRNSLTELLYANGETQFVIFEPLAVRAIVGDVSSPHKIEPGGVRVFR
jgi:hypothetical protein